MKKKVIIYSDGACSGNPGKGGWGAILMHCKIKKEISGYSELTTNNQMELTAVIEALKMLKYSCAVEVYSDSAYVVNAFIEGWINAWVLNGYRTAGKKDLLNKELWQELIELVNKHEVKFVKVKGHADNEFNNRCDYLARKEIEKHL